MGRYREEEADLDPIYYHYVQSSHYYFFINSI